jgi:predicted MFS family arabinose efflux permease
VDTPTATTAPEGVPEHQLQGRKAANLVAALLLGVIAIQLTGSMISPALPEIGRELNLSPTDLAQVSSVVFLSGAVGAVVLSRWSDSIGRRRMFLAVLIVMSIGTLICLLAPNLPILLVGRVLQGFSTAIYTLSYLILGRSVAARLFGPILGLITAINGGVGGLDGFLGGVLADAFGYRSIFAVTLAVSIIAIVVAAIILPRDHGAQPASRMDWWGALLIAITIVGLNQIISNGPALGWGSPITLGWIVATVGAAIGFWFVEKHRENPLFPVQALRSREVWPLLLTTVFSLAGVIPLIFFTLILLSQDKVDGYGLSAAIASLLFLTPPSIVGLVGAPLAGWLAARRGWVLMCRLGLAVSVVLTAVIAIAPSVQWLVFVAVLLLGLSFYGFVLTTTNGLGVIQSPPSAPGSLPGLNGSAYSVGAGLGVVVVAPFIALGGIGGYQAAIWASAALMAIALVAALILKPRHGHQATTEEAHT